MKATIFSHLETHLNQQVVEANQRLDSLKEALESEAKSTAGDKHETGRAMIHQEMAQVQDTLNRVARLQTELLRMIQSGGIPRRVASGVLIETDGPWILLGLGLGRLVVNGRDVLAVSAEAPLARQLQGAVVGDEVRVGMKTWVIRHLH
ncbi:MAG: hypothetical protein RLZZ314_1156 [Bacteroidota bacterium]|jgi:hypothetical protein